MGAHEVALVLGVITLGLCIGVLWRRVRTGGEGSDPIFHVLDVSGAEVDAIARSQIDAGSALERDNLSLFQGVAGWAAGTTELRRQVDGLIAEHRAMRAHVLDLEKRFLLKADASWQMVEACALVIGSLGAVVTIAWAALELLS